MVHVLKYEIKHWYGIALDILAKLENCGSYFMGTRVSKIVDSLSERVETILIIFFSMSIFFLFGQVTSKMCC